MRNFRKTSFVVIILLLAFNRVFASSDPLPSWNNGAAKTAVIGFVRTVTAKGDGS